VKQRRRGNPGLKGKLVDKSVESYVMALETINRLSIAYRVEASAFLLCNAWELLLKAKLIEDAGSPQVICKNQGRRKGERVETISARTAVARVFQNGMDPVRRNIERVIDIRNDAAHLVLPDVPSEVVSLFQASVVNYHQFLDQWFGLSLSDRVPAGMMAIVYDFPSGHTDLTPTKLRRKLGSDAADYLLRLQDELRSEHAELGGTSEYSIGIDYTLALTKTPGEADIALTQGTGGDVVGLVEVAKDPSKTHPMRQKEILAELRTRLGGEQVLNGYDIQCVVAIHNIRQRSEFFYRGTVKGSPGQYSPHFVDWVANRWEQDPVFFVKVREAYRRNRAELKAT
jgi:hypothetical protein